MAAPQALADLARAQVAPKMPVFRGPFSLGRAARSCRRAQAIAASLLAFSATAAAQDRERGPAPEVDRRTAGTNRGPGQGSVSEAPRAPGQDYDESDELPETPTKPGPTGDEQGSGGILEGVEVKKDGRVRLQLGYDSNVFRSADRSKHADGFFHGLGEAEVLFRFKEGRELFLSGAGEGIAYFTRPKANEMYVSGFGEYFHPIALWLDAGVQNTLEYTRQNLLDDNGDLLPRETFNSFDEEPRLFAILHSADVLSLEVGSGVRYKNFDEEPRQPSLDFYELRADAAVRARVPWWPDGKAKVKYRWRERDYFVLRALSRRGIPEPSAPRLTLERHQVNASFAQKVHPFETDLTVTLGYGFTYNQDTWRNDRSYREHAGSLRFEWWVVKETTRIETEIRGGARDFLVRRVTIDPQRLHLPTIAQGAVATGHHLRHRFVDVSALVWQKIVDHIAVVAEVAWFDWASNEPLESYGRFVFQAGIEGSF